MIPLYDSVPTRTNPVLTFALIALNVAVFGAQLGAGRHFERLLFQFGAIPLEIVNSVDLYPYNPFPVQTTLITSMFMHGGLWHLAGNMLYLWIFGNNVEDVLGKTRFIFFYFTCGIAAAMSHIMQFPTSTIPMVGASGAVSGILAGYVLEFPRARVLTFFWFIFFFRIIPLPAWILIGFWFMLQIVNLGEGGQVAWSAHVGGFVTGLVLWPILRRKER